MNGPTSEVTGRTEYFSGRIHTLVVRADGRRLWLDPAFLFALRHAGAPDLAARLSAEFGATPEEARAIPDLLVRAGLLPAAS